VDPPEISLEDPSNQYSKCWQYYKLYDLEVHPKKQGENIRMIVTFQLDVGSLFTFSIIYGSIGFPLFGWGDDISLQ